MYQNDGDIKFIRFLTRLSLGYERVYGKKVTDECFKILGVTERSTILKQIKDKYADLYKNRKLLVTQQTQFSLNKEYTFIIEGIRYDSKTTETSFLKKIDRKIQSQADKAYITLNSNLKTNLTNPLNKKIIQLEYNDDKDILPTWLTDVFICKFCYVEGIDDITEL